MDPVNANPRVAVIGCGLWGRNHVRVFGELGALAAVCDAAPATAEACARAHAVRVRPVDEVLSDPEIDAVVVATPATTHAAIVANALNKGKHVLVEKPLALTLSEAERLSELAMARGRTLMVGHLLRYHPAFVRLQELVEAGALGAIRYMYSNRLNLGKIRTEENILWSFAPHDISMILALAGREPSAVTATGAFYLSEGVADVTTTHLAFSGQLRAHIFVSWLHPYKEQKLVVVGEHAMAVFNDGAPWDSKLTIYDHRILSTSHGIVSEKAEGAAVELTAGEPLRREAEHLLDCVRYGRTPLTDGAEALRVLRVLADASRDIDRLRAGSA